MNSNRVKAKLRRFNWILKDMVNEVKRCPQNEREDLIDMIYEQICEFDEGLEKYTPVQEEEPEAEKEETVKSVKEKTVAQKPVKDKTVREAEVKIRRQTTSTKSAYGDEDYEECSEE